MILSLVILRCRLLVLQRFCLLNGRAYGFKRFELISPSSVFSCVRFGYGRGAFLFVCVPFEGVSYRGDVILASADANQATFNYLFHLVKEGRFCRWYIEDMVNTFSLSYYQYSVRDALFLQLRGVNRHR